MNKKIYHIFNVFAYKGGELNSRINLSFEDLVDYVDIDIDDLKDSFSDYERSHSISNEEWENLSNLELLNLIPDDLLDYAIESFFYPGCTYAYDNYSDYNVYETTESGKLKEINPCKIPGFNKAVKEKLIRIVKEYE